MFKRIISLVFAIICSAMLLNCGNMLEDSIDNASGGLINYYDVNLSSLDVSAGVLSFEQAKTVYSVEVAYDVSAITITAVASDLEAAIRINDISYNNYHGQYIKSLDAGNNIVEIIVIAPDGITTKQYFISINRLSQGLSNNANLSNLATSAGSLSGFDSNGTVYNVEVSNATSTITVTPTVAGTGATVKVNGTTVASGSSSGIINLVVGSNVVEIVVTAQNGQTTKTYVVSVNRLEQVLSNNANLSNLTTSAGSLSGFDSNKTAYNIEVANATSSITVTPTVTGVGATLKVNGVTRSSGSASQSINLVVGINTIEVVVTAQNSQTTKTYTVVVNRLEQVLSNNANLSNLTTSAGSLSGFDSNKTAYNIEVANATSSITVTPTVTGVGATLKVNGVTRSSGSASQSINLVVGINTIEVVVTAQNSQTTKTYTVVVNRLAQVLSNNANLSNLATSAGSLSGFDSNKTAYNVEVANSTNAITVTPTVAGTNASVKVNGTTVSSGSASQSINLVVGINTIEVVVTAQNSQTTKTYVVSVNRLEQVLSNNANLSNLTTSAGSLSGFDSNTTAYNVEVANSTNAITVTPTVSGVGATLKVNGVTRSSGSASQSINLVVGINTIEVVATAENSQTTKTYTVVVNRLAQVLSNNANLSNLTTSAGSLSGFDSNTTAYNVEVANSTNAITVTPTVAGTNASVKVNGTTVSSGSASQSISLAVGINIIEVVATAENSQTTKTYVVVVTRLKVQSTNANLFNLSLSFGELSPSFTANTTGYNLQVDHTVDSITVTPTAAGVGALITVDGQVVVSGISTQSIDLSYGTNTITIVVTAQDGTTTKTYTVVVTKLNVPSNDANLSGLGLLVGTLSPNFAVNTINYSSQVAHTTSFITVTPIASGVGATIKVQDNTVVSNTASQSITLSYGANTITIVVIAQDGTTIKTYTVVVTRLSVPSTDANLSGLSLSSGTLNPNFAVNTINGATAKIIIIKRNNSE